MHTSSFIHLVLIAVTLLAPTPARAQATSSEHRADCGEWHECRQLALDALARGEYERFHDLAWRTVQTGPARNADLMFLLARAQSLSGRPHDALVMLGRLADMAVLETEALTSGEFSNVRALREWPELESKLRAQPAAADAVEPAPAPAIGSPAQPEEKRPAAESARPDELARADEKAVVPPPLAAHRQTRSIEEALRLPTASFDARGLAYDTVSGRFVVADPNARKLIVLDERSRHVIDLVRGSSAGFFDITSFQIDPRRGDLWVVSSEGEDGTAEHRATAVLHKLQLVSGRPLGSFTLPDRFTPARFEDVAVTPGGTVLALDTLGGRIFAFHPDSRTWTIAATPHLDAMTSLAAADERTMYVAHAAGVARVDAATGALTPLHAGSGARFTGFKRIRFDRGSLAGVQQAADGTYRAVLVHLPNGRAASVETIETDVRISDPTAAALAGDDLYVLTHQRVDGGSTEELVVQRIRLR